MKELYLHFGQNGILLFLFTSLLAIVLQAFYVSGISTSRLRKAFEALILIYIAVISVLLRVINVELLQSFLVPQGAVALRGVLMALIYIIGIILVSQKRGDNVIYVMVLVTLTMPNLAEMIPRIYVFLFGLFWVLITTRAGLSYWLELDRQKQEITEHSVKEALDAQYNGILFAEKNGSVLLINKKMLSLMNDVYGEYIRNAETFWHKILKSGYRNYGNSESVESGLIVVSAFENESWQFMRKSCMFRGKEIYQIIAVDVSEQERINRKLEEYQEQLVAQKSQLEGVMENLEELKKQEARGLMWNHVHDVLGQRISILQRELRVKENVDYDFLQKQIDHLIGDLNFIEEESPSQKFEEMIQSFQPIGVRFHIKGRLPKNRNLAGKLVEIIREATTNAVRHGQAEHIFIQIYTKEGTKVIIENDGKIPEKEVCFGGGLNSIRTKAEELGGKFEIRYQPRFAIVVEIPEGVKGHNVW